jgi:hypothetical protein
MADKKALLEEMTKNLKGSMILKYDIKEVEDDIREEYASIHQLKNKKGEIDKGQVKSGELKTAMTLHFKITPKDALLEKYERQHQYIKHMEEGDSAFPLVKGKKYLEMLETKKDLSGELNEIKKVCAENEIPEIEIQAMTEIAKLLVAKEEEKIKDEIAKKEGKKVKGNKGADIEMKIQELLKELGIKL